MKPSEFVIESLTSPYPIDIGRSVETRHGARWLKGIDGKFVTDAGQQYEIDAINRGYTKAERDESKREWEERKARGGLMIPSINKQGGMFEVHFTAITPDPGIGPGVPLSNNVRRDSGITGSGDAMRVFATVMDFVKELIDYKDPSIISIKSKTEEGNRSRLYSKLANKYASQMGYEVRGTVERNGMSRIELRKTT